MVKSQKSVFWQAFIVAAAIFVLGIMLGLTLESSRLQEINEYYAQSEISLMDSIALANLAGMEMEDCERIISFHIEFADRIYQEALLLEKYDEAGRITEDIKLARKKYDSLRTILWINLMKIGKECAEDFDSVVYLYEYETTNINKRAQQSTWSRVLLELKQKKGDKIILVPIAGDSDLSSLKLIMNRLDISDLPVVVINEEIFFYEPVSVSEIEKHLS